MLQAERVMETAARPHLEEPDVQRESHHRERERKERKESVVSSMSGSLFCLPSEFSQCVSNTDPALDNCVNRERDQSTQQPSSAVSYPQGSRQTHIHTHTELRTQTSQSQTMRLDCRQNRFQTFSVRGTKSFGILTHLSTRVQDKHKLTQGYHSH